MREYRIENSGKFVPYRDYASTSAIRMKSTSSDPLSLMEVMLVPIVHEEVKLQVDVNSILFQDNDK